MSDKPYRHGHDHGPFGYDAAPDGDWHNVGDVGAQPYLGAWVWAGAPYNPTRYKMRIGREPIADLNATGGTPGSAIFQFPAGWWTGGRQPFVYTDASGTPQPGTIMEDGTVMDGFH